MMKNLLILGTAAVALAVAGCSTPEANPASASASGTTENKTTKGAAMKGIGADQIHVTSDGANADKMTGSALKGGQ
jgi:hypothetical protein